MLYYSAETNAVYDDQVHGTRTLFIEDEAAQKAKLKKLSDDEKVLHEQLEGNEDQALAKANNEALDAIAEARRLALLNPPLKEVENPDCRLPADAVPITPEKHAELMAAQGEGKTFRPGADGQPVIVERERSPEEILAAARAQRDKALAATDWTQLPDALDAAKRKLWAAHRKRLREMPAHIEQAIADGLSASDAVELVVRVTNEARPN